jgi:hypothetical protein
MQFCRSRSTQTCSLSVFFITSTWRRSTRCPDSPTESPALAFTIDEPVIYLTNCLHACLVARLLAYPRFFYKWLMVSIIFGQIHTMHNCGIQCKLHCCDLIKLLTNMRITLDKMPDTRKKS